MLTALATSDSKGPLPLRGLRTLSPLINGVQRGSRAEAEVLRVSHSTYARASARTGWRRSIWDRDQAYAGELVLNMHASLRTIFE